MVSMIVAGLCCAAVMKPERGPAIHAVALVFLIVGSYMDSQATNLTRPDNMYLSQALIAAATAIFLPPAILGGLLGTAVFGSFVTIREKFHSNVLAEHIVLSDPLVAQRVTQLANGYGRVITDKALLNAEGIALLSLQTTREANIL
eukprot:gene29054-35465_t